MNRQETFLGFAAAVVVLAYSHFHTSGNILAGTSFFQVNDVEAIHRMFGDYVTSCSILPISIVDLLASIYVCFVYRKNMKGEKSWLETFFSCMMLQFGGRTLAALFLGEIPQWVAGNGVFPAFLLAWWLTFACPLDVYWETIRSFPCVVSIIGITAAISNAFCITRWGADHAINVAGSRSKFVVIFTGILSSCGSAVLGDFFNVYNQDAFMMNRRPRLFDIMTTDVNAIVYRSIALSSIYYICLTQPSLLYLMPMTRNECRLLISCFMVMEYFLLNLFGLSPFTFMVDLVRIVFGIKCSFRETREIKFV